MPGLPLGDAVVPRRAEARLSASALRRALPLLPAVGIGSLAAANGGYFPSSWGWAALAFAWVALLALLLARDLAFDRWGAAYLGALAALTAWVWISAAWASDLGGAIFEGERMLVYLTGVLAALLLVRRVEVPVLVGGIVGACTLVAAYALATRLFPDRIGSFDSLAAYRLAVPVGYWNALGILCALAALLAVGLAAESAHVASRSAAAASLVVLLPALFFTYSRGAWIALAVGIACAVALSARRLRLVSTLLVLSVLPAIAVLVGSRSQALTHKTTRIAAAAHDGHRLAVLMVVLLLVQAGVGYGLALAADRVVFPQRVRLAYAAALVVACVVGVAAIWATAGSPYAIAQRGYHAFASRPPTSENLNARLRSFSGNGRVDLWRAGWQEAKAHPLLGGGAGSYGAYWLRHRKADISVVDTHDLYLETLAELGPLGLALLALALGIPLAGALRARRSPLVAAAFGAYAAYLVHVLVDWDWEVPAVTLTALLAATAIVVAARGEEGEPPPLAPRVRMALVATTAVVSIVAFVALAGNVALSRSSDAAARGDWAASARHAKQAKRWLPWSAEPWRLLGEAQLVQRRDAEARASLRTAIRKDEGNWLLWFDLAAASHGAAARSALARARALNPIGNDFEDLGGTG